MKTLLEKMLLSMDNDEPCVMASIVASSGSTPRGTGARMLIDKNGRITGTIGGGNVEYRCESIAKNDVLKSKEAVEYDFSLTKDDVQNLGMICGGDVHVYFTYIDPKDTAMRELALATIEKIDQHKDLWLITDLNENAVMSIYTKEDGMIGSYSNEAIIEHLDMHPDRVEIDGHTIYYEQICFAGNVIICGGGHVARALVPVLTNVGFPCIVVDDRPEFSKIEDLPGAVKTVCCDYKDMLDHIDITENDFICIMTRGHAGDMVCEAQALKTKAYYIGVIGSKKKRLGVEARLKEEYGVKDEDLKRVTNPIGLEIYAQTPEEIAISVTAQLIEVRARKLGIAK